MHVGELTCHPVTAGDSLAPEMLSVQCLPVQGQASMMLQYVANVMLVLPPHYTRNSPKPLTS